MIAREDEGEIGCFHVILVTAGLQWRRDSAASVEPPEAESAMVWPQMQGRASTQRLTIDYNKGYDDRAPSSTEGGVCARHEARRLRAIFAWKKTCAFCEALGQRAHSSSPLIGA